MRVGIFDSGIGGLTVFRAIREAYPALDLLYLGDTARIPYGTRSPQTVLRYSLAVASYLWNEGIDAIVIACNTATSYALPELQAAGAELGIPVLGVIEPGVDAALRAMPSPGTIAVLGTEGTIAGGAYQRALATRAPSTRVEAVATPLFVPLVEEGWLTGEVPLAVGRRYLGDLAGRVDVAILGCTHYPLLRPVIQELLPTTALVDSASALASVLGALLPPDHGTGETAFLVTDHVDRFQAVGERFLGYRPTPVRWVDLPPAAPPFALPIETHTQTDRRTR